MCSKLFAVVVPLRSPSTHTHICIVACFFLIHSSVQCVFTGGLWMWVCMRVCLELKNGSRRNCTVNLRFTIFQLKSWAHICSLPFSRSFCCPSFSVRLVCTARHHCGEWYAQSTCATSYIVMQYEKLYRCCLHRIANCIAAVAANEVEWRARWRKVVLYGVTQHPNRVPSASKSNGNKWRTAYVVRKRKEILEVDSPSNMFQICFNLCAWIYNWKQINGCL